MKFVYFAMILYFFAPDLLVAQTPILDESYKIPMPKLFVISRSDTPAYVASQGEEQHPKKYEMGELFFGIEEKNGRILLGKYDELMEKFTEQIGWVPLDHVLVSRFAQTIGQGVQRGYLQKSIQPEAGAFTKDNQLFLRVVSEPQHKISPSSIPGIPNTKNFYTFTWYYVMDYVQVNGVSYYLLADQENLFETLITDTDNQEAKRHLLGWVETKKVTECPSNLVFEINSQPEAITERYTKKLPALVYSEPDENSKICCRESLDIWKEWMANGVNSDVAKLRLACPDPYGLAMEIPRYHIIQRINEEWYQVGFLGPTNQQTSQGDVGRLFSKLDDVKEKLRAVDICFVIDGSGSMCDEIYTVEKFCKALCQRLAQNGAGYVEIEDPFTKEKHKLYVKMDMKASLVVYRNVYDRPNSTEIRFRGISLETGEGVFEKGFKDIDLSAYYEDLHAGLHTALTAKGIWRSYATRLLVVIGDEKGDSTDQDRVFQAMPLPPLNIAREVGLNIDHVSQEKLKQEYTKIIGIYTAPSGDTDFPKFQQNLNRLTDIHTNTFWVPDITSNPESKKKFVSILENYIQQAQDKITDRLKSLAMQINPSTEVAEADVRISSNNLPTVMIIDNITLQEILKDANITLAELQHLQNVAFIKGYIKIRQTGHHYDTFRERVLISKPDLTELRGNTSRIYSQLKGSLEMINPGKTRKQSIAEALVLAIAEVTGTADEYVDKPAALAKAGRELIKEAEGAGGDITIIQKLKMRSSLPISSQDILGMTIRQVINLTLKDIILHTNRLNAKVRCMDKILNGEIAPEIINQDFSILDDWEQKIKNEGLSKYKYWFFPHPISGVLYTYMPLEYIP